MFYFLNFIIYIVGFFLFILSLKKILKINFFRVIVVLNNLSFFSLGLIFCLGESIIFYLRKGFLNKKSFFFFWKMF